MTTDENTGRAVLDCGHKLNTGARVGLKRSCVVCEDALRNVFSAI